MRTATTKRSNPLADLALKTRRENISPGLLLCLDPGDTTGYAVFRAGVLKASGQFRVDPTTLAKFHSLMSHYKPDLLVVENYRVYQHKLKQHANSTVPTIQYIGAIRSFAQLLGIPIVFQWAFQAKGFGTDYRLRELGLYQPNRRHANDAIRHAVYWYIFHPRQAT
jgi:hypothetical protein